MQCRSTAQGSPACWRAARRQRAAKQEQQQRHQRCSAGVVPYFGASAAAQSAAALTAAAAATSEGGSLAPRAAATFVLGSDEASCVFSYLSQPCLQACYYVCRTWQRVIEDTCTLNLAVKTEFLENQCYDAVYNFGGMEHFGQENDFCFEPHPHLSVLTENGWQDANTRAKGRCRASPRPSLTPRQTFPSPATFLGPVQRASPSLGAVPRPVKHGPSKLPAPSASPGPLVYAPAALLSATSSPTGHHLLSAAGAPPPATTKPCAALVPLGGDVSAHDVDLLVGNARVDVAVAAKYTLLPIIGSGARAASMPAPVPAVVVGGGGGSGGSSAVVAQPFQEVVGGKSIAISQRVKKS